ncbi:hypothetical protein DAEQUDRAFT_16849 [Daedalea quercina L-15889]|uniref:Uncharacterized protein n=1 Tax=Daedalea quercina L-15889 TaxID=1314783 RepID=A0A165UJF2_9APHY|nr:hypothetical protein DAEQUDRAFT_16849 [Daedalea quercina L-15889]
MDSLTLPVGAYPRWEQENGSEASDDDEPQELRSIPESLVVFQSLRQSRNKWLSSAFPKFSAKARGGKPPEVVPPPHSIKAHGKFDVRIGPHIFSDTTFYEVYYLPDTATGTGPPSGQAPTFYAYQTHETHQANIPFSTAQVAATALAGSSDVRRDLSDASVTVTPDLVAQVSAAATTNPALKDLLHLAAVGKATAEQQKTLANLIRSMGTAPKQPESVLRKPSGSEASGSLGSAEAPHPIHPPRQVREFDIVIEFQEKPSDRWIVPRGPTACERVDTHSSSDVLLSIALRPTASPHLDPSEQTTAYGASEVVSLRISEVSQSLWELLLRWSGGEDGIARSRDVLKDIAARGPPRTYLQYQLPDGPLLEQLKNTVPPRYNMKPVMPSNADSTRSRRKPPRKRRGASPHKAQAAETPNTSTAHDKHKAKPRVTEPPVPIACWSCGRADVPLLNFGSAYSVYLQPVLLIRRRILQILH